MYTKCKYSEFVLILHIIGFNMRFKATAILLMTILLSPEIRAQKLNALPKAPEITVGTLPDGISYYLVNNASSKGYADFALVQKGAPDKDAAREKLRSLPHFPGTSPYRFLAGKGVGYTKDGFISFSPDAAVYNFEAVPVYDQTAVDSTLLLLFDLAQSKNGEQAIMISGDISAAKFPDKLKTMSLFVTPREKQEEKTAYKWTPSDSLILRFRSNPSANVATINITYRMPRMEQEYMGTPVPLVTEMFTKELSSILQKRITAAFREAGIPLAAFRTRYTPSSKTPADESFSIIVTTGKEWIAPATSLVAKTLAHIDEQGIYSEEFQDSRMRIASESMRNAGNDRVSNSEYVSRCVSSYLYGADLASDATKNDFFARRALSFEHEQSMLNRFTTELISPDSNITLRFNFPSGSEYDESLKDTFALAWAKGKLDTLDRIAAKADYADTLGLFKPSTKIRQWQTVKEPITGGELWSFTNGMKVIYKRTSLKNEFYYGYMIRGGFTGINGLLPGESSFVSDMLGLYDIAGMTGKDFDNMLTANGITMDSKVTVSDLQISGHAPSNRLTLLLKSLLSIANQRELNPESFEYYKNCESLRLEMEKFSPQGLNAVLDSIICPEYRFPEQRSIESLRNDLPSRADVYFNTQFKNCSDGVLVLIGDLDPATLKNTLSEYLGGFKTGRRRKARETVEFPMSTGWSTYIVDNPGSLEGDSSSSINVAMSAMLPFTMERFLSFKLASTAFERRIVKELAEIGVYAEVSDKLTILPVERMTIFINCWLCSEDGLPDGILPEEPLKALAAVRSAISSVSGATFSKDELKAMKADLLNRLDAESSDPEVLVDAAILRYSAGKDIISNYKQHLDAVTDKNVREIIDALGQGSKVEYILK